MLSVNESSRIEVATRTDETTTGVNTHENVDDQYILSAPLCKGSVKLASEQRVIYDGDVRPGMLRILVPGQRVTITRRSRSEALVIAIPGARLRQWCSDDGSAAEGRILDLSRPITTPNFEVERLCRSFWSASELAGQHRQLFIDGLTCSLISLLMNAQHSAPDIAEPSCKGRLTDLQLARCLDYADERLAERLELGEWANVLGMSTSEFARRFQQKTGVAPYTWFMNWRIDRAKQLLSKQGMSVVEVAFEVGFCSQSHFTEAFRRRVGVSPGRWRAQRLAAGF